MCSLLSAKLAGQPLDDLARGGGIGKVRIDLQRLLDGLKRGLNYIAYELAGARKVDDTILVHLAENVIALSAFNL